MRARNSGLGGPGSDNWMDNLGFRQAHREIGTFSNFTGHGSMAVVGFNDGFDEAQAEAEAALGTAFIAPIEARPDLSLFLSGNADARVAKVHDGAGWLCRGGDGDSAARRRVFNGVV